MFTPSVHTVCSQVDTDFRVSVFDLKKLRRARRKRLKQGKPARLAFDGAPSGPWADGRPTRASSVKNDRSTEEEQFVREATRMARANIVAGKEPGCQFYFLLHPCFVDGKHGAYRVPVAMSNPARVELALFQSAPPRAAHTRIGRLTV